jgi:branched-chain amino acid transport system ATP-binding protein
MSLFSVGSIGKRFGGLAAVDGVSFDINPGEILGIIGPNGAGKTTLFNLMTGLLKPTSGEIRFRGDRVDGRRPSHIASKGIARTFQNIRLFDSLTVIENVLIGGHIQTRDKFFGAFFRTETFRKQQEALYVEARRILAVLDLDEQRDAKASSLSYGAQRRLEIARALMGKPTLLLLDEPAAGMNTGERISLAKTIRDIQIGGLTMVVIEHDMKFIMSLCQRIVVIDHGQKIFDGAPEAAKADRRVIEAYLGAEE